MKILEEKINDEESQGGTQIALHFGDKVEFLDRGTKIVLHLKEDQKEFLTEEKIQKIISDNSLFVSYPINMCVKKTRKVKSADDTVEESNDDDNDEPKV